MRVGGPLHQAHNHAGTAALSRDAGQCRITHARPGACCSAHRCARAAWGQLLPVLSTPQACALLRCWLWARQLQGVSQVTWGCACQSPVHLLPAVAGGAPEAGHEGQPCCGRELDWPVAHLAARALHGSDRTAPQLPLLAAAGGVHWLQTWELPRTGWAAAAAGRTLPAPLLRPPWIAAHAGAAFGRRE
jgi:hypothetical protein